MTSPFFLVKCHGNPHVSWLKCHEKIADVWHRRLVGARAREILLGHVGLDGYLENKVKPTRGCLQVISMVIGDFMDLWLVVSTYPSEK